MEFFFAVFIAKYSAFAPWVTFWAFLAWSQICFFAVVTGIIRIHISSFLSLFQINRCSIHRRWFLSDLRWFDRISDWHFTWGLGLFSVSGYRNFPPICFGGFLFKVIHFQLVISGSAAAPNGLLRRKNRQTFTKSKIFALLVSCTGTKVQNLQRWFDSKSRKHVMMS